MSFRLRILLGLAAVVVVALGALAAGTAVAVRDNLVARLDSQLSTASASLAGTPGTLSGAAAAGTATNSTQASSPTGDSAPGAGGANHGDGDSGGRPGGPYHQPPPAQVAEVRAAIGPEDYVAYLAADGTVTSTVKATVGGGAAQPLLPKGARPPAAPTDRTRVTTALTSAGSSERVAVTTRSDGTSVLVAGSLGPVDATVRHLVEYEIGIGAIVLLAALSLGTVLARQATRPLEQIAATADAITAGDLDRRIPDVGGAGEIRRVGGAFNTMLASIGAAFARRDATEAQLRRFLADASHELATPLTSIKGYAELFRRGLADRPEDLATALGRIEAESARMGRLVDDLLLLARLDAIGADRPDLLHAGPVDLGQVAADTAADLRVAAPTRAVTLSIAGAVPVIGDEDRLRQVAANLASNARRHTPEGTPVHISAFVAGGRACLAIADDGPGLSSEEADLVFERFYRVDAARSRAAGGTGLGLSIVAGLAEAHGGHVSLATEPGAGATFTVTLPLADRDTATTPPATTPPATTPPATGTVRRA